jgi:hypothetical protein
MITPKRRKFAHRWPVGESGTLESGRLCVFVFDSLRTTLQASAPKRRKTNLDRPLQVLAGFEDIRHPDCFQLWAESFGVRVLLAVSKSVGKFQNRPLLVIGQRLGVTLSNAKENGDENSSYFTPKRLYPT